MSDVAVLERLQEAPIVNQIDSEQLALISSQIAPGCTKGEVGHFLELCTRYELDPFAREAWCAKSKGGKLLVIVGRDGLRKIAQRNGVHVDGDVVREHDDLTICRTPDGNRTVAHSYSNPKERGAIIGAWAECREGGPLGRPLGYFYAPLDEYMPSTKSDYSPWQKQTGVMILAAAERQAIRQATPLSGLLAVGEDAVIRENERDELTAGGDGEPQGLDLGAKVDAVLERAAGLGHAGLADRATAEIALGSRSPAVAAEWVAQATVTLDEFEAALPPVADVVEPSLGGGDASSAGCDRSETGEDASPQVPAAQELPLADQEALDA